MTRTLKRRETFEEWEMGYLYERRIWEWQQEDERRHEKWLQMKANERRAEWEDLIFEAWLWEEK